MFSKNFKSPQRRILTPARMGSIQNDIKNPNVLERYIIIAAREIDIYVSNLL